MTTAALLRGPEAADAEGAALPRPRALPALLDAYERSLILAALAAANGHQRQAARLLGIGATTLNQKMKRLHLRGVPLGAAANADEVPETPPPMSEQYRWRGRLPSGHRVEIRAVNGDIHLEPGTGDEVEVVASKPARTAGAGSPSVEVLVVQAETSLAISARYTSRPDEADVRDAPRAVGPVACPPPEDLRVSFTVRVPRASTVDARTLNGDVDVRGLCGAVRAESASGNVSFAPSPAF